MSERYSAGLFHPRTALFLRFRVIAVLLLCLTIVSPAVSAPSVSNTEIDKILDAPALHGGITALMVQRLSDHKIVFAQNADLRLMPASNRKLFTTAAVLAILGPDFTISTPVLSAIAPNAEGTVDGDIYLRGAGDSLLTLADIDDLAKAVAAKGVKRITGGVVGDGSVFEDGPYGTNWGWDTLNDDYAPAITGLDVNDGVVKIEITPGTAVGAPVAYTVEPFTHAQAVVDTAVTAAKGTADTVRARHPWRQDVIILSGSLPVDGKKSIEIPVADPVAYAADLFRLALLRNGISVEGAASTGRIPASATVTLAVHKSPPMGEYIKSMNKPSDNLLAESLIRVIGIQKSGHGDYDSGDDAEMAFLTSLGIDTKPLALDDGSGVSRANYVTARSIVDLLAAESKQPYFSQFRDSLPIAGVDGTLRHRFIGTPVQGNLRAKTGTLTAASALSGYFSGASGAQYTFSLLMNNYPGTATEVRGVQDKLLTELVREL